MPQISRREVAVPLLAAFLACLGSILGTVLVNKASVTQARAALEAGNIRRLQDTRLKAYEDYLGSVYEDIGVLGGAIDFIKQDPNPSDQTDRQSGLRYYVDLLLRNYSEDSRALAHATMVGTPKARATIGELQTQMRMLRNDLLQEAASPDGIFPSSLGQVYGPLDAFEAIVRAKAGLEG